MLPLPTQTPRARRAIPGTPVFDGDSAQRGLALNTMCYSFNSSENRAAFAADEEAYMARFHLSPEQLDAVRKRDVTAMIAAGGNVYYLAKLAGIFGLNVQDLGALQTGMPVDEFKAALLSHAVTERRNAA
jgi:protocatechuate 4,5-dioxygenase alpha chain